MQKCPLTGCHRAAVIHARFGVLPCSFHQLQRRNNSLPHLPVEITTEEIREGRKEYFTSTVQPWRGHTASREFIEAYPDDAKKTFTPKEIKKAQYVWSNLPGWKNRYQSK